MNLWPSPRLSLEFLLFPLRSFLTSILKCYFLDIPHQKGQAFPRTEVAPANLQILHLPTNAILLDKKYRRTVIKFPTSSPSEFSQN